MVALEKIASPLLRQAHNETTPLNPGLVAELDSLSHETDSELFYGDLLRLGRRFQDRDRPDWALKLYAAVAEQAEFPALAKKAQTSIAALEGRGEIGARAEVLVSRFVKDLRDPAMIVPMLAGTTAAGLARSAGLGALAGRSAAWYTRGLGARLTAGSLAFAAEVPTFVATGRALRGGTAQNTWGRDLQSGALSLGAIKLFSLAGKQGLAQLHGVNEWGGITRGATFARYSHPLVHQASLFGGLMIAHRAETKLGLRPQVDGATAAVDTLASMLSLGAGMRLGTGLLGRGYARQMRELEWRTQNQEKDFSFPSIKPAQIQLKSAVKLAGPGDADHIALALDLFDLLDFLLTAPGGKSSGSGGGSAPSGQKKTDGRLEMFSSLKEKVPSLSPAELEDARLRAEDFFKKTSFDGLGGNRGEEINIGLAALSLLETAMPHAEPGRRGPYLARIARLALHEPEELVPPALASFKRSLPLVGPNDRAAIAELLRSDLGKSTPKRPAAAFILFADAASELPPARKRSELQEILRLLNANKALIDEHSAALLKNQQLLRDFVSFAEGVDESTAKDLRNRLQLLEGHPGGIFGWFRNKKADRLRKDLADPPEMPFPMLVQKFKEESGNPSARRFNPKSSILEVQKVRELLGQEQPSPPVDSSPDFSLRKYFQQEALREYLHAEPRYFENFNEQNLRNKIIEKLRGEAGYRELFIEED